MDPVFIAQAVPDVNGVLIPPNALTVETTHALIGFEILTIAQPAKEPIVLIASRIQLRIANGVKM